MSMFEMKKLLGLNRRAVGVIPTTVAYLAEAEVDGKLVTNVYFSNGAYITVAHSYDETHALLYAKPSEEDLTAEAMKETDRKLLLYRMQAETKANRVAEINAAVKALGLNSVDYKQRTYESEILADGSRLIKIYMAKKDEGDLDPIEEAEARLASVGIEKTSERKTLLED